MIPNEDHADTGTCEEELQETKSLNEETTDVNFTNAKNIDVALSEGELTKFQMTTEIVESANENQMETIVNNQQSADIESINEELEDMSLITEKTVEISATSEEFANITSTIEKPPGVKSINDDSPITPSLTNEDQISTTSSYEEQLMSKNTNNRSDSSSSNEETVVITSTADNSVLLPKHGLNTHQSESLTCRCYTPSGDVRYVTISSHKSGTYKIDMNAYESGLHRVMVESNGIPVPGSPFNVRIMQATNVYNVRAFGPGLQSATADKFRGVFLVDTSGGGPASLVVKVQGPKGCYNVDMFREGVGERVIRVTYDVGEGCGVVGVYTVQVVWGGRHIRGSPFRLFLGLDNEQVKRWERRQLKCYNG